MRILLTIFILVFVAFSGTVSLFESRRAASGNFKVDQTFIVRDGDDFFATAEKLEREGLVRDRYVAAYALLRTGKARGIVAGPYRILAESSPEKIASVLVSGKTAPLDIQVTFPEGFTVSEMADRLTRSGFPGEDFRTLATKPSTTLKKKYQYLADLPAGATLEGYLFPDTYRFFPNATGEEIIMTLLDTFEKKAVPVIKERRMRDLSDREVVVLASIVEGEVRTENDRRMVSDLFLRRLAIGQPLQSDATLRYALGETKVKYSLEETRTESPYNTYAHKGLPPGPINNPGLISIRAVCDPLSNGYFYFLNDAETGETIFAKTFDEHVRNKAEHGL